MSVTITITTAGLDRYVASLDGRELCRSRTPLLSAARVLRDEGVADHVVIVMRREGETGAGVRSTVGRAAGLTVLENDRTGPIFAPHRPAPVRMPRQPYGGYSISAVRGVLAPEVAAA